MHKICTFLNCITLKYIIIKCEKTVLKFKVFSITKKKKKKNIGLIRILQDGIMYDYLVISVTFILAKTYYLYFMYCKLQRINKHVCICKVSDKKTAKR